MTRAELLKIAKPILFNTEMVTAILEGRKTVTRRLIKPQPTYSLRDGFSWKGYAYGTDLPPTKKGAAYNFLCNAPFKPDDIIYVRETWGKIKNGIEEKYVYRTDGRYPTLGDGCFINFKWKPSIHMPKEAARIFLKVKDVRVERLKNMVLADVLMEGIAEANTYEETWERWHNTWDSTINKSDLERYGWDANPYVWVIEFERIETVGE